MAESSLAPRLPYRSRLLLGRGKPSPEPLLVGAPPEKAGVAGAGLCIGWPCLPACSQIRREEEERLDKRPPCIKGAGASCVATPRQAKSTGRSNSSSAPNKDKRGKYFSVPISNFDEVEFIFQDKHASGEFMILQTPYDYVHACYKDFIGDTEKNVSDVEVDPVTHYDSDCLPDDTISEISSSKCP
ncbi:hypothetical protein D1007_54170 [Hordeum vulgare]|nr:hypothetical protein D1007_54170 [Hordeum vulgare]